MGGVAIHVATRFSEDLFPKKLVFHSYRRDMSVNAVIFNIRKLGSDLIFHVTEKTGMSSFLHTFTTILHDNILASAALITALFAKVIGTSLPSFAGQAVCLGSLVLMGSGLLHLLRAGSFALLDTLERSTNSSGNSQTVTSRILSFLKRAIAPSSSQNEKAPTEQINASEITQEIHRIAHEVDLENSEEPRSGVSEGQGVVHHSSTASSASLKARILFKEFIQCSREQYKERERCEKGALLERRAIPRRFYQEPAFNHRCPITGLPIRHPVVDPLTHVPYERAALERWIEIYHTSPLTKTPLKKADLIFLAEEEEQINHRLGELQREVDAEKLFHEFLPSFREEYKKIVHSERGSFLERQTIPSPFYDDDVFSQYQCPITGAPIRHPAIDPNTQKLYERTAIERWIDEHRSSPSTTKTLRKDELLTAKEIQAQIDSQLQIYQEMSDLHEQEIEALSREIV